MPWKHGRKSDLFEGPVFRAYFGIDSSESAPLMLNFVEMKNSEIFVVFIVLNWLLNEYKMYVWNMKFR